jgi:hypothetical protein
MHKEIELVVAKNNSGTQISEEEFALAPNSFFQKICVQDVLEMSENPDILDSITEKVRKGGSLILEGIDALDICRRVHYGDMSLKESATNFFSRVNNLNSVATLKIYFAQKKWPVKFAGLNNGRYLMEVTRT